MSLKGLWSLIIFMSEKSNSWMMKLAQCYRQDPTDLCLYFENSTQTEHNIIHQTIRSSNIDPEHCNQSDRDTCQAFVDVSTVVQNGIIEMLNDTCTCTIIETEPVIKELTCLKINAR